MELKLPNIFKSKKTTSYKQDVVRPVIEDGSAVFDAGGVYINEYFVDGIKDNNENIEMWRTMSRSPDVSSALSEIITDSIVVEDNKETVSLDFLEDADVSNAIKEKLIIEFSYILKLLNFHKNGDENFLSWIVDGVQYYHKIFDDNSVKAGIKKLVKIDPLTITPVKEIKKGTNDQGIEIIKSIAEYFLIENDSTTNTVTKIKIPKEAIAYIHSGVLTDGKVMSILNPAVKPNNQLTDLEDSTIIYTVARAPQKRVFYVDVGNMPKTKAEQYMNSLITKFKNKVVYDSSIGAIKDSRHISAMVEDYWLPRKNGNKGTEISTIEGGADYDNLDEMLYFRKKIYKALNVPTTRLDPEQSFSMGRDGDITRDEVKFSRYVSKLRNKYAALFNDLLKSQAVTKGILTNSEWLELEPDIKYVFLDSTHFSELIETEMYSLRFQALHDAEMYTGKYYSNDWVRRNILKQTEDQIKDEDKKIKEELNNKQYKDPEEDQ